AYTTLAQRLTGYTTQRIDLARPHAHIGIQDPRHLTLARTIVRSGNIRARADKILFDKFRSIPPRDLLQLIRRIFLGIDADAALGAPKWDIDNSALERHERRQRHDLVEVDTGSKTNAPLTRGLVMRMLNPVGLDDLYLIPDLNGEEHPINCIALFDLFQDAGVPGSEGCCLIKAFLNGFEKFVFHLACLGRTRHVFCRMYPSPVRV